MVTKPCYFVVNALAPAEVIKVVIDEEAQRVEVVVAEDQLSLAIGRRGPKCKTCFSVDWMEYRYDDRG